MYDPYAWYAIAIAYTLLASLYGYVFFRSKVPVGSRLLIIGSTIAVGLASAAMPTFAAMPEMAHLVGLIELTKPLAAVGLVAAAIPLAAM